MKILFVAIPSSIHSARWVNQFAKKNWELYLYPSVDFVSPHPEFNRKIIFLKNNLVYRPIIFQKKTILKSCYALIYNQTMFLFIFLTKLFLPFFKLIFFVLTIKHINPDYIHSLEFQHAGYQVLEVKKIFNFLHWKFPKWIATNWGSDIYLFGKEKYHAEKISEILKYCDRYSCECSRDVCLAKKFGFRGKILPIIPNSGGFDLSKIQSDLKRNWIPPSRRTKIMVKGYEGWSGRARLALEAILKCKKIIRNYEIIIHSIAYNPELLPKIQKLVNEGLMVRVVKNQISHREMLKLYGEARIAIGISISDAISTAVLEAMVMGAFPIQSNTSCAGEWFVDGKSGILVPSDNIKKLTDAISKSLKDDDFVDKAAKINWKIAKKRLDAKIIEKEAVKFYQ